jgi:hypothetical protein
LFWCARGKTFFPARLVAGISGEFKLKRRIGEWAKRRKTGLIGSIGSIGLIG